MKKISEDAEQNKVPILAVLSRFLDQKTRILEIGSGTGQHAVYFGAELPHLEWQTSDLKERHPSILSWLDDAKLKNVKPPVELDVSRDWPDESFGAVFSANTTHIISWEMVRLMFQGIGRVLDTGGYLILYGPFNFEGKFISESNKKFDLWLKEKDPKSGVRNFEDLDRLANENQMELVEVVQMPVNNRILVWKRL